MERRQAIPQISFILVIPLSFHRIHSLRSVFLLTAMRHLFPYACTDRATVNANELFAVFNAAKQFIQTQEQISLYEELVRKGNSTHSVDEVVNFASIKIGNCLIFCDKKFRILSYSTSIPVTDVLWKENIERGYCTYEFISNVMSLEAVQSSSANIEAIEVSCPESPYRKCSSKVFLNGVQVGFRNLLIEGVTAFTTEHLAAMSDELRNQLCCRSLSSGLFADPVQISSFWKRYWNTCRASERSHCTSPYVRRNVCTLCSAAVTLEETELKQQICPSFSTFFLKRT